MIPRITIAITMILIPVAAQASDTVGVEERLAEVVPLDGLVFFDEDGRKIALADLVDRPVALSLVFFRCAGLCTPLLNEIARVTDIGSLEPGEDFRLISVSFDTRDTPALAKAKKANQLQRMERRRVDPEAWRFLTGTQPNIDRLTQAVGFNYTVSKDGQGFNHPGVVVFLSKEGKICRYLHGTSFNPMDIRMAVEDTSAGHPRSLIRKLTQLCYAYDPVGRTYVLKINRIILGVTVIFALVFAGYLVLRRGEGSRRPSAEAAIAPAAGMEGGRES